MPIYTRKETSVEAVQFTGPDLNVTSFLKGDQVAKDGDFLVVDPHALDAIKLQGGSSPKGSVYVIPKAEFVRDFNVVDDTVVPVLSGGAALTFDTLKPAEKPVGPAE